MLLLLEKGDVNLVSSELLGCRWRPFLGVGVRGLQEGVLQGTFCRMDRLRSTSPRMPPEAVKADMPAKLSPVLATLVDKPRPRPDEWLFEIKFDGYRMLARIDASGVRLISRNGLDWSSKMPHLVRALEGMKLRPGWLDGEVVMLNERGLTDFNALQNAFDNARTQRMIYFFFDVPFYGGYDLRAVPLVERRALLQSILAKPPEPICFSEAFDAPPQDILASACELGLEGIIGKRKASRYPSRRSPDWIKLKCSRRQEFVIGGYTDPQGSRTGFGGLLVGYYDEAGELIYAGKVGTGFNEQMLRDLLSRMQALATDRRPFKDPTENDRRSHWVEPKLVAEVVFTEWTPDGRIRHPSFKGLRTDKMAEAIVREKPMQNAPD
ncbi:non-homologous end-joining DNA ligase [Variovorax paradoxus]|nr:non-homologous end-joining DNA ligase [Variovorax paradoxus]